jgi:hypothetical protein
MKIPNKLSEFQFLHCAANDPIKSVFSAEPNFSSGITRSALSAAQLQKLVANSELAPA